MALPSQIESFITFIIGIMVLLVMIPILMGNMDISTNFSQIFTFFIYLAIIVAFLERIFS
jgi:hypothetical protein